MAKLSVVSSFQWCAPLCYGCPYPDSWLVRYEQWSSNGKRMRRRVPLNGRATNFTAGLRDCTSCRAVGNVQSEQKAFCIPFSVDVPRFLWAMSQTQAVRKWVAFGAAAAAGQTVAKWFGSKLFHQRRYHQYPLKYIVLIHQYRLFDIFVHSSNIVVSVRSPTKGISTLSDWLRPWRSTGILFSLKHKYQFKTTFYAIFASKIIGKWFYDHSMKWNTFVVVAIDAYINVLSTVLAFWMSNIGINDNEFRFILNF